jgi:hypothetical protein
MTRLIIFIYLLLPMISYASVFDVLDDKDRYNNTAANEFDVNEGDETKDTEIVNPKTPSADRAEGEGAYHNVAKIAVLNKITARSKELSINVGKKAYFGNIEITVRKCFSNGDLYLPSHKILVSVVENKIDEDPKNIFNGWLISSNIPVSTLQNPSYEIIALECHDRTSKK